MLIEDLLGIMIMYSTLRYCDACHTEADPHVHVIDCCCQRVFPDTQVHPRHKFWQEVYLKADPGEFSNMQLIMCRSGSVYHDILEIEIRHHLR